MSCSLGHRVCVVSAAVHVCVNMVNLDSSNLWRYLSSCDVLTYCSIQFWSILSVNYFVLYKTDRRWGFPHYLYRYIHTKHELRDKFARPAPLSSNKFATCFLNWATARQPHPSFRLHHRTSEFFNLRLYDWLDIETGRISSSNHVWCEFPLTLVQRWWLYCGGLPLIQSSILPIFRLHPPTRAVVSVWFTPEAEVLRSSVRVECLQFPL